MKKVLKLIVIVILIIIVIMVVRLFKSMKLRKMLDDTIGSSEYESYVEIDESDDISVSNEESSEIDTEESLKLLEESVENQKKYEKMVTITKIDWDYHTTVFSPRYTFEKDEDGKWMLSSDIDDARPVSDEEMKKIFTAFVEADVESWHEFYETNLSVLDGSSFMLNIYFEDDASIFSGGTNSFPDNFNTVHTAISEVIENNIGD